MMRVLESPSAAERLQAASEFVAALPAGTEVLIVGASRGAVDDLVRRISSHRTATFGLHRFTLMQLAARLAAPSLAARGLATCTRLGAEAVAARATFDALAGDRIPYFAPVARCPGFGRSVAATASELRGAGIDPHELVGTGETSAATGLPPVAQLGVLLAGYAAQLERAALADRATLLRTAAAAIASSDPDPLVALPLVLLDVPIETRDERTLVDALRAASPRVLATVPSGDERTLAALADTRRPARGARRSPDATSTPTSDQRPAPNDPTSSLSRLQTYLFTTEQPPAGKMDESVRFFSAPGEGRESVEIARWILDEAHAGTPFDQMVVFLRSPETYTPLLETAFRRAGIPAYFARGARRPNPSGRAFLALLSCASDRLSARRFAEYLSFGQVPRLDADGAPPSGRAEWSGPRDEAFGAAATAAAVAGEQQATTRPQDGNGSAAADLKALSSNGEPTQLDDAAAPDGTLRVPWKWEELLIDAAVIGGVARWRRRLNGLEQELRLKHAELASTDPDAPQLAALERALGNLAHLRRFALPVIERLDALPSAAPWGEWLTHLAALAPRVLRRPEAVLECLAELEPMAEVGPVGLDEVREVLAERLTFLTDEPPKYREGRVLVTTLDDARGRAFAIAFVPGLAERIFPQPPREDPLLLDALRERLSPDLATKLDRLQRERLRLRLAVGAAERRVYLSYPRVDVVQGRPRVTSFYGLDVVRATEGGIPDVEVFERDAAALVSARLAWPAPPEPTRAIDAAEHDLATLAQLIHAPAGARVKGGAQYLVELNPHLARALRGRFARWERKSWSALDGIVRTTPAIAPALAAHRLAARPYSPSALEQFAACPYRFFLAAMQRLEPRVEVAPLEQLDPLTRGRLIHRVQAETLRALARADALPITAARLAAAEEVLGATLDAVAARFSDDLAPPIPRVWQDEIAALRGDLVYWLRHLADQADTWHPTYFEYGFGLPHDAARDPHSHLETVSLPGGWQLRGAVDLIERRADGAALRVTDHKTGADRTSEGMIVGGGETLQPVLYGLAVEAALRIPVAEARLFFCTSRGGFGERVVRLDDRARAQAREVLETIDRAIAEGHLHPAPRADACRYCDFHMVCGPHEEERLRRKDAQPLADLSALRQRP